MTKCSFVAYRTSLSLEKTEESCLDAANAQAHRLQYREVIKIGEQQRPLPPDDPDQPKKKGRKKKTKERNLLERLRDFENDTLLFMAVSYV